MTTPTRDLTTSIPEQRNHPDFDVLSCAPLNLADRCDSCHAQAYVRATFPTTAHFILLCNHHGDTHQFALVEQGARIFRIPVGVRENDTDH